MKTTSRKILAGPELPRAAFLISDEIRWAAVLTLVYRVLVHDEDATGIGRSGTLCMGVPAPLHRQITQFTPYKSSCRRGVARNDALQSDRATCY